MIPGSTATLLVLLLAPQGAPGKATVTAGETGVQIEGGAFEVKERSLVIVAGRGRPGFKFRLSRENRDTPWQADPIPQVIWLGGERNGVVRNLTVTIQAPAGGRRSGSFSGVLWEPDLNDLDERTHEPKLKEVGPVSGTFDLPDGTPPEEEGVGAVKGGLFTAGFCFLGLSFLGWAATTVSTAIAGFREGPWWGWLCLLIPFGSLVYWFGHRDTGKWMYWIHALCTASLAVALVALFLNTGQTKS